MSRPPPPDPRDPFNNPQRQQQYYDNESDEQYARRGPRDERGLPPQPDQSFDPYSASLRAAALTPHFR